MKKVKPLKGQDNISFRLAKDIPQAKLDYLTKKKSEVPSFSKWCYDVFLKGLELELEKEAKGENHQYTVHLPESLPDDKVEWACNPNTRKIVGKMVYQTMFTDQPIMMNRNEEDISKIKKNPSKQVINRNAKNLLADLEDDDG